MSIDISSEILEWFNTNEVEEEATSVDREVWGEFYESLTSKASAEKYGFTTATLASGPAYIEEDHGGSEGDGETRFVVFSVGDQFFQVDGYYASWDGTTWEDTEPFEVFPKEVTVIQYERK